jgi:acyl-coenzyme A synthetase/AMP-(fatty) acid ligase
MESMNLYQKFEGLMQADPQAAALVSEGKLMTRKVFMAMVDAMAAGLHAQGVKAGDVVGISLPNSPQHLVGLLALARLGAISLPLHPRSSPQARRRLIVKYKASTILIGVVPPNADQIKGIRFLPVEEVLRQGQAGYAEKALPAQPDPSVIGRISLTSGTSGEPSAVAYTHENWLCRLERTSYGFDASTRMLVGSLHLTLGNILAYAAMLAGGLVVFPPLQAKANTFMETVQLYGVTHASLVPSGIKALAAQAPQNGLAFPTMKQLRVVGGALSDHLFQLATSRLTPNIVLPYGTSELGLISMASTQMLQEHPDHVGRVVAGGEVQAVDANGNVLGPDELGELRVKVPLMPQAYYQDEARTNEKFRDGWFYTSDIGKITAEGFIKIEGRADDRINIAGTKLFPDQVERVLNSHPAVLESAIFTVPEPTVGKKMVAAIVLEEGAQISPEQMAQLCRQRKLGEKTPAAYFISTSLPRNPSGKLMRAELPALLTPETLLTPIPRAT